MLRKLLKSIRSPRRSPPPHEQLFRVIKRSGVDYYAIGVLPNFATADANLAKRSPYHVLRCQKTTPAEAAICRELRADSRLVREILEVESDPVYKGLWAACLYGGRFDGGDSGTHFLEFDYCTSLGNCRPLVRWQFDFAVSPQHNPSQVALEVCDFMSGPAIADLKGQDLLIPSKNARRFWHTLIERKMLHSIGALKT